MLSVVVVGRNDNHGYNLSKRVANSLNSIAMRLSEGDELVFVDWNTPRPFPPMPISIIDDLTEDTKRFLRIITIEEKIHNLVKGGSSKNILEPIARNVGIRRTSDTNKWILSTNTDIIFVGEETLKFQDRLKELDQRLWQSFRYEIPEYVWELFDKRNPAQTNQILKTMRKQFPMRLKLTTHPDSTTDSGIVFADAVGDFQLAPRNLWFKVGGFPEDMLKGWHVDSRLAYQMVKISELDSLILTESFGLEVFHQNHLRSLTHFHINSVMNNESLIVKPYVNSPSWGLRNLKLLENGVNEFDISSIRPDGKDFGEPVVMNLQKMHKRVDYDVDRTLFFLNDELRRLCPGDLLILMTANISLHAKIKRQMEAQLVKLELFDQIADIENIKETFSNAHLIIIDFGIDSSSSDIQSTLLKAGNLAFDIDKISKLILPGTRVALIRSQNWALRTLTSKYFSVPLFNNYSALLIGFRKKKIENFSPINRIILKSRIAFDYNLKYVSLPFNSILVAKITKLLPKWFKSLVRRYLFS